MWYDRPDALCTHRPQMRSVSTASGTSRAITPVTFSPLAASISSSIRACSIVLGKPSRMKPCLQSSAFILSLMMPTTISSDTKPPLSITALAFSPISLPLATASLSMSPVESCGVFSLETIFGACVPLPAPGGPKRMSTLRADAAGVATNVAACGKDASMSFQMASMSLLASMRLTTPAGV